MATELGGIGGARAKLLEAPPSRTKASLGAGEIDVPQSSLDKYKMLASNPRVSFWEWNEVASGSICGRVSEVMLHGTVVNGTSYMTVKAYQINIGTGEEKVSLPPLTSKGIANLPWAGDSFKGAIRIIDLFNREGIISLSLNDPSDPLRVLREKGAAWMGRFVDWYESIDSISIEGWSKFAILMAVFEEAEGKSPAFKNCEFVSLLGWKGAAEAGIEFVRDVRVYGLRDAMATFVFSDGRKEFDKISSEILGNSPAAMATRIASMLTINMIIDLNATFGIQNTLTQVLERGAEWAKGFCLFLEGSSCKILNPITWEKAIRGYDLFLDGGICVSSGFAPGGNTFTEMVRNIGDLNDPSDRLSVLIQRREAHGLSAVDIEEFARGSLPENSLVESVTIQRDGKVRIILKERFRPNMVQFRSRTYIETGPGSAIADMWIAAFDLDFRNGNARGFPNAIAYNDKTCRIKASHTNISPAVGSVCLGDINRTMSSAEIAMRGGVSMPSLGEFIQMLKQCNLDSAYRAARSFVLKRPEDCSAEMWTGPFPWDIPGLVLKDLSSFAVPTRAVAAVSRRGTATALPMEQSVESYETFDSTT
jgi:hypothetical protein